MTKTEKLPSLNGYHTLPRFMLLAVQEKIINTSLLGAHLAFVALADFHLESPMFGHINLTYTEIASRLNVSPSTVERWAVKLIKTGLLQWHKPSGYAGQILACTHYWAFHTSFAPYLGTLYFQSWDKTIYLLDRIDQQLCNVNLASKNEVRANMQKITSQLYEALSNSKLNIPYKVN